MIPILLDTWLLEFSSYATDDEMNARANALRCVFSDLKVHYPLEVLPFFSPVEQAAFWGEFATYKGADRMNIAQWINALSMEQEPLVEPAMIIDAPCPDLPKHWLKILAAKGSTDNPPLWRSPMIFTPDIQRPTWPNNDEINYTHEGTPKTRNLISIERCHEHKYFMPDIDPWRLGCVGEPMPNSPVDERPTTCRRLPRPQQLQLNLPLSQLAVETRKIVNPSCGKDTHYFYLPPATWQPTERGKDNWRNNSFECDGVVLKERGKTESGYVDRNGHIWVWDKGEKDHWDVKTSDDIRIARVCYSGLKKRS